MKDPFRNFNQFKIDPLSEIRNAGIVTNGEVYWVSSTADSDHTARIDALGRKVVRIGLQEAIDEVETDQNDYVLVIPTDGGTVRDLGTAVDVNEDRVHILGVGYKPAPMAYNGLTFRGYAAAAIDTELVAVTGAGVELGGLKFLGTSGTAAGGTITSHLLVGTAASGTPHDLWVHDVHVENTQAAAANGTAPILRISGDVAGGIQGLRFDDCWMGDFSWAPTALITVAGTAGPTRPVFNECTFVLNAQATSSSFALLGTGVTEVVSFDRCKFINVRAGTLPASAVTGAILVDNPVIMTECVGLNVSALGTDTEVFTAPNQAGTAGAGAHNPYIAFLGSAGVTVA